MGLGVTEFTLGINNFVMIQSLPSSSKIKYLTFWEDDCNYQTFIELSNFSTKIYNNGQMDEMCGKVIVGNFTIWIDYMKLTMYIMKDFNLWLSTVWTSSTIK